MAVDYINKFYKNVYKHRSDDIFFEFFDALYKKQSPLKIESPLTKASSLYIKITYANFVITSLYRKLLSNNDYLTIMQHFDQLANLR